MLHRTTWPAIAVMCACTAAGFSDEQTKAVTPTKKKDAPRITSTVEVKQISALSDHDAHEISFAAGRILKHVAQARSELHHKKVDGAKTHVDQGLKLITIIEGLLPRQVVRTEIKSGDHVYLDEDQVVPEYATIFSELEQIDIVSPVVQAKREHTRKRGPHAEHAPAAQSEPAYVVSHEELIYSAIKLNLTLCARKLNEAKQGLQDGKAQLADEALLAIQTNGVLFVLEEVDLPLREAADNLKLAEREMKQGHQEHAKAALHVASDQLKLYEKKAGENRSADVKALHAEIDKLTAELGKATVTDSESQKHASTISDWWQRATKWFKKR